MKRPKWWVKRTSTKANASQTQRWISVLVVITVAVTAIYFINDGRQLTRDVENFLNSNSFKILGEVANLQREILKAQTSVKDLRLEPLQDIKPYSQRYASAKISLRNIKLKADSEAGSNGFAPRAYEILDLIDVLIQRNDELSEQLTDAAGDPTAMRPILREIDRNLGDIEFLINELYLAQEARRVTFLSEAIDSIVRSRLIMVVSAGAILFAVLITLYNTQQANLTDRAANERFSLASSAVNSAIYDWDVQRDSLIWTEGIFEVFGHRDEDLNNQITDMWQYIHPDDLDLVQYTFAEARATGNSFAIEHRFKATEGIYLDVSNRVQVVSDSRGVVTRMVGSIEDITERRLMLSYQESNRAKSRLLAHVSHELKTPLSAIIGYTEIIHAEVHGPVTTDQRHVLERVLANARSLLELINSLLSQTRAEEQDDKVTLGLLAPEDLVQIMHEAVGVLAESKGLALTHEIDGDLPPALIGDIGRLRQIITNLAGNAVKFTDEGEIHIYLFRPISKFWAISIKDSGIGISVEDQKKIFDAFTQVDESLQADSRGFGLGLSIVKQIVSDLDGTIELESQLGQGSTFTVILPLIKRMEMS